MNNVHDDRFYDTDVPYVFHKGTNYDIGLRHGKIARERIDKNIKTYERFYKETAKITWKEANNRAKKFIPYIQEKMPLIMDELRGIADGSGQDLIDILTLNVRSEICLTNYSDGCSSISQQNKEDKDIYISQNWDWLTELNEGIIILDIQPTDKPRMLMMTEAGIIAKIGFNDKGLGLMLNAIMCGVSQVALPVHFAIRRCLEAESTQQAISELEDLGIASTANLMLADNRGNFLTVEASPKGFAFIEPDDNLVVAHTNHLYASKKYVTDHPIPDSFSRLARLVDLSKNSEATYDDIRRRLSDEENYPHSIDRGFVGDVVGFDAMVTIATLIVDISKLEGEISFGRPSSHPKRYQLFFS
ncbi:uncharacterized protein PRCAT00000009001 [Priceomyces carsonii]|uniref:uncharacterized protein n=1 Tax=Priceomyces carsonii TaxID=28549 RepID=UPI002ED9695C|nr:unnamed protein product [Priceomyces carsonii]